MKDLEEYLGYLNREFEGHTKLVSLSLQKQELSLQERLTERDLLKRVDRRKLKEQIIKGSQKSTIKPKHIDINAEEFKIIKTEIAPKSLDIKSNKLIEFAKRLKQEKEIIKENSDSENEEDEEEIINLDSSGDKVEEENINQLYNKKRDEINKTVEGFAKEIEKCKSKKLPIKIIERLKEKEMKAISAISEKFSKMKIAQ